ncbi:MAG: TonB-dependent receptor [Bacteroidales bacterium]|nr:TonB-dependent receptor [Bacteroidales bacterium]
MKKIKLSLFLFLITYSLIYSQNFSISGTVDDSVSSVFLQGVNIRLFDFNTKKIIDKFSTVTDIHGQFSINDIKTGKYFLKISHIGYRSFRKEINIESKNIKNLELKLSKSYVEIGEIVVSSLRQERMLKTVSLPIALVDNKAIEKLPSITTSDILQNEPGLSLSRDGIWATSINIRGLNEQRIVALIDGNRIETATDISAGLSLIDINDIERIEVIKGSASSLYGSGALGGVINIITKRAYYNNQFYVHGNLFGGYNSVNNLNSEGISLITGSKKWHAKLSGTIRNAENTQTPEGELENSQFTDNNFSGAFSFKPLKNHEIGLNYQRFYAKDVGIPGGAAFPGPSIATYPEEIREMMSATYSIKDVTKNLSKISFKYFDQYIFRDVEMFPNTPSLTPPGKRITPVKVTPSANHNTNGILIQTDWNINKHNLIFGIDAWQRKMVSKREKHIKIEVLDSLGNVLATNNLIKGEVPVPDSKFKSAGLFIQDEIKVIDNKLSLLLGGRIDRINVTNEKAIDPHYTITNGVRNDNPTGQRITFEANDVTDYSWSLNVGLLYNIVPDYDITFNLSRAFRSPTLEERFKYIDLGSTVRLGDPDLKPEDGCFFDIGLKIWKPKFSITANTFINSLSNLIVEESGEFIYSYNDTANFGIVDTLPALINSNVDKALLYGFDINLKYNFYKSFVYYTSASFVRGIDTKNDVDLPLIPPFNVRIGLKYSLPKYFGTDFSCSLVSKQNKTAINEIKTGGYAKYDIQINSVPVNLKYMKMQFFAGVENITDRAYKNHLATNRGIINIEPGRNLYFKINLIF